MERSPSGEAVEVFADVVLRDGKIQFEPPAPLDLAAVLTPFVLADADDAFAVAYRDNDGGAEAGHAAQLAVLIDALTPWLASRSAESAQRIEQAESRARSAERLAGNARILRREAESRLAEVAQAARAAADTLDAVHALLLGVWDDVENCEDCGDKSDAGNDNPCAVHASTGIAEFLNGEPFGPQHDDDRPFPLHSPHATALRSALSRLPATGEGPAEAEDALSRAKSGDAP